MRKIIYIMLFAAFAMCAADTVYAAARPGSKKGLYFVQTLTGGGSFALDSLDITAATTPNQYDLIDGDAAIYVNITGPVGLWSMYVFDANATDAEDSPRIIRPDDYATQGVWRRAPEGINGWRITALSSAPTAPEAGVIYWADNESAGWDPATVSGTDDYAALYTGSSYVAVIDINGNLLVSEISESILIADGDGTGALQWSFAFGATRTITIPGDADATIQFQPSEGGFADGDKTKLDGIEASADVTDATNVAAAGAAMEGSANTFTNTNDFSGGIVRIPSSATLPATCSVGDQYMDTDATSGQRHYLCESANTWILQGDGGGGAATEVNLNTNSNFNGYNITGVDRLTGTDSNYLDLDDGLKATFYAGTKMALSVGTEVVEITQTVANELKLDDDGSTGLDTLNFTDLVLKSTGQPDFPESEPITILDPANGDDPLVAPLSYAITITNLECVALGGGDIDVDLQECNANGASCVSGGVQISNVTTTSVTDSTFTDADIDAGDYLKLVLTNSAGTLDQLACRYEYSKQ